jgi:hypothetical protein
VAAVPTWNMIPDGRDAVMGTDHPADGTASQTVMYRRCDRG